ncbi:PEP-CTERM sorting domain-containing protein [Photobacterium sanctipauli]|uniref:PEP-CTERM sorting domain-containing protein n=1 Tax=Photobacterium sanctipauli TaxID=1342794 RepID=A0A2T3NYX0_9GAMM|nr:PEP-CTERM sorting domain-containing protein [Photobacterium sanctipauli]PSW21409.1 PEP-CTERM sorting domain-containing protein [Photobacterium sanctipauli]
MLKSTIKSGALLTAISAALFSVNTSAAPLTATIDGVLMPGEYLGGDANGTNTLTWYNDHESIYDYGTNQTNDLHWEMGREVDGDANSAYLLNVFFEVPGHARRMIWENGCDYDEGDTFDSSNCTELANALMSKGLTEPEVFDVFDAYEDNHHGDINFSHNTQTGSELFELQTDDDPDDADTIFMTHWDGSSEDLGSNYVKHATSYDWVLDNGCTTTFCDAWEVTASIEVQWSFNDQSEAQSFLANIGQMRLHLSDEARGLPILTNTPTPPEDPTPPVSEPATLGLLGLGLLGILRIRSKKERV